jgi:hypothetical protein
MECTVWEYHLGRIGDIAEESKTYIAILACVVCPLAFRSTLR